MQDLDARLVAALGLANEASGLHPRRREGGWPGVPPSRFGPGRRPPARAPDEPSREETTPSSGSPTEPAPRAEAAFSAAQVIRFKGWEPRARPGGRADVRSPPALRTGRRRILHDRGEARRLTVRVRRRREQAAGRRWGRPPRRLRLLGLRLARLQAAGGTPARARLASTLLKGRPTYAMSGEAPKARRIAVTVHSVAPGVAQQLSGAPPVEKDASRPA